MRRQQEEPVSWGTCHNEEDRNAVLQTLASVTMRSAAQGCRAMFPRLAAPLIPPSRYEQRPPPFPTPEAPQLESGQLRSPASPPPLTPRPVRTEEICKDWVDAI